MNKKGQVAIFVIVAILIIAGIGLFYVFSDLSLPRFLGGQEIEPNSYLSSCFKDAINSKLPHIILQGGFVNPEDYKIYDDVKATYLCKNVNYYEPCIAQHPLLLTDVKKELESQISGQIDDCFNSLQISLQDRNYQVSGSQTEKLEIIIKPEIVELSVDRELEIISEESTRNFDNFVVSINSPLYGLLNVAQTIAAQEAKFCYFEYVGYSNLYPRYNILHATMSDSTEIYTIQDKESGLEMNVAIRGCAIPA